MESKNILEIAITEAKKQERTRIIKLAIDNDILCPEDKAIKNGCITCRAFWKILKESDE